MAKRLIAPGVKRAESAPAPRGRRWLILVHLLPPTPSKLRVRTWRRLQEMGAIAVKQSVYVLPDTAESREDIEWLKVEIEGAGGEAIVYSADHVDPAAEAELIDQFRHARQKAYTELASELRRMNPAALSRQGPSGRRDLARYRDRFLAIERLDFFGSAGRDHVIALLASLDKAQTPPAKGTNLDPTASEVDAANHHGRLWVTRPHPGVDRMSSAWLIRRFIDPVARFGFITDIKSAGDAIPFDMFGGGFGHKGDRCTFETLAAHFGIADPAVSRIAEIVHDLDLKDDKFRPSEAATLGIAIDGLRLSHQDDHVLLDHGMTLFEALYRSFAQVSTQINKPPRPRVVVTRKRRKP
jgi:hypothetical protein